MKRIVIVMSVILAAAILSALRPVKSQVKPRRMDLSGEWVSDKGDKIIITQTPYLLTAAFAQGGGDCPLDGPNRKRPLYLKALILARGLYQGSKLQGEMGGCTSTIGLIKDCGYDVAYIVNFTADKITETSISGTYVPDYINYDEKDGHYTNCRLKKGGASPRTFSLTRKCNPDKGSLCETLGNAARDVKAARTQNASAAFYQQLQMNIGDQLAKMRTNLCDDQAGLTKLAEIEDNLDSLKYAPGAANMPNNVTLGYIENGIRDLIRSSCAVGPPVQPPSCAEGSQPKSEADAKLLESFRVTLFNMLRLSAPNIIAYDESKKCLAKMFADACAPQSLTKTLGAVSQARYDGLPIGDNCDQACAALGDWYEKTTCPDGLPKSTVITKCKLACIAPEWGQ